MPPSRLTRDPGRRAFGADPANYHGARPDYPDWVWRTLQSRCALGAGTATFEIGAGTGKATRRLLDLGAGPLVAVEPDARLADFLRAAHPAPALTVLVSAFEDSVLEEAAFDLGVCGTAFHWLDEDAALARIARLLRPGGWWAAFWNVFGDDSRPRPVPPRDPGPAGGPANPSAGERGIPFGLDTEARLAALTRIGAFDIVDSAPSAWSLVLDADQDGGAVCDLFDRQPPP